MCMPLFQDALSFLLWLFTLFSTIFSSKPLWALVLLQVLGWYAVLQSYPLLFGPDMYIFFVFLVNSISYISFSLVHKDFVFQDYRSITPWFDGLEPYVCFSGPELSYFISFPPSFSLSLSSLRSFSLPFVDVLSLWTSEIKLLYLLLQFFTPSRNGWSNGQKKKNRWVL